MIREYVPLLLLIIFVIVNAAGMLILSQMMSPQRPTRIKASPYESGMPPLGDATQRFSVKFYLVAMLFLIFDVEAVFLIPWAVTLRQLGLVGFIEMLIFVALFCVAYMYAWNRGALDWD